jgi:hypothetical protein
MQTKKLSLSQELADKYMMNFIKRIPITFVKGKGCACGMRMERNIWTMSADGRQTAWDIVIRL